MPDLIFKRYREESHKNWGQDIPEGSSLCIDQIRLGSDLRVADSFEQIAESLRNFRWLSVRDFEELEKLRKENIRLKRLVKKIRGA